MIWIIRETIWTVIKSRRIFAGGLIEIQSQFLSSDSLISKPFRYLVPSGPTWRRNRNRSMLSASPLFPAKIYPQIYISSRLLFARFFLATRQRNNTLDSKRFRRYVYARKVIMVCSFFLFREKKKKEERKKIEFLRVEETLEKKESRNLSSKALKSHLPMVASDVKQSPSLSLSFRYFSAFPTSRVYLLHLRHVGEKMTCRD